MPTTTTTDDEIMPSEVNDFINAILNLPAMNPAQPGIFNLPPQNADDGGLLAALLGPSGPVAQTGITTANTSLNAAPAPSATVTLPPQVGALPADSGFVLNNPASTPPAAPMTDAEFQRAMEQANTLLPPGMRPKIEGPSLESLQAERARQIALDQPMAAVDGHGNVYQQIPLNDPAANSAEFAKLWQTPGEVLRRAGDVARAGLTDAVTTTLLPVTYSLYGVQGVAGMQASLPTALKNVVSTHSQPLPVDVENSELSRDHPVLATISKTGQGVAGTLPTLAVGGELPALVKGGLALDAARHIVTDAGSTARTLGTEFGKNPEDRNNDAISSAISDTLVDLGTAPYKDFRDGVERVADKPMYVTRKLSDQLGKEPIEPGTGFVKIGDDSGNSPHQIFLKPSEPTPINPTQSANAEQYSLPAQDATVPPAPVTSQLSQPKSTATANVPSLAAPKSDAGGSSLAAPKSNVGGSAMTQPIGVTGSFNGNLGAARDWAYKTMPGQVNNKATDTPIRIARQGIDKTLSRPIVQGSPSAVDHTDATRVLPQLLENATPIDQRPAPKPTDPTGTTRQFLSPVRVNGRPYTARITVKEHMDPSSKRFYTLKSLQLENGTPGGQ